MTKILVFNQPFPMGNYKLNTTIAEKLSSEYETYAIQQLNGIPAIPEYIDQLVDLDPDILYFEMLDKNTFEVIEKHFKNKEKILCCASGGILGDPYKLTDYKGKWFDKILSNSSKLVEHFKNHSITAEHFKYYFSVIDYAKFEYTGVYDYDSVFLGMGFNRISSESYSLERSLYFHNNHPNINFKIFGNGWDNSVPYGGILPYDDIEKLYTSAKTAVGIIAKGQRGLGMVNNRYTEIVDCLCPLITYNYPEIDWYGLDKYLNFVDSAESFNFVVRKLVKEINNNSPELSMKSIEARQLIRKYHDEFMEKLNYLICC